MFKICEPPPPKLEIEIFITFLTYVSCIIRSCRPTRCSKLSSFLKRSLNTKYQIDIDEYYEICAFLEKCCTICQILPT